jgi:hypothetical protein
MTSISKYVGWVIGIRQLRKLALLGAMLLVPGQAMAEDVRVDCVTDQRIVCRDDETTCRPPSKASAAYHFTFDLTKKAGTLVFCSDVTDCMKPSSLTVVLDHCAFLHEQGAGCLVGNVYLWEPFMQQTYAITDSRYVMTASVIAPGHSLAVTEFGHCTIK